MTRPLTPPRPCVGERVMRLDSVTSTSELAKELARSGEPHGTAVVAAVQTHGRGQGTRPWASPPGGLWASLVVRPVAVSAARAGLLGIAAGAAAAEAASVVSGVPVGVKWPNDLLVGERKAGGVLVETSSVGADIEWAVIGIGINANIEIRALPERLRRTAACLRGIAARDIPLDDLLREICRRVEQLLNLLEAGDDDEVLRRWRALDATPGRRVRALRGGRWRRTAVGVDGLGRLVVRTCGGESMAIATSSGIALE